jgi:hypothetical protein
MLDAARTHIVQITVSNKKEETTGSRTWTTARTEITIIRLQKLGTAHKLKIMQLCT